MAILEKEGAYLFLDAFNGIPPNEIPSVGGGAVAPNTVVMFMMVELGEDFISDPTVTLQMMPGSRFTNGTDSDGNISVTTTWVRDGTTNIWNATWNGLDFDFTDGFFNTPFRALLNVAQEAAPNARITYYFQIAGAEFGDFSENPARPPIEAAIPQDVGWDEEIEEGDVTFSFQLPTITDEDGVGVLIAPNVDGTPPPDEEYFDWGYAEPPDAPYMDWAYTPPGLPQGWWYKFYLYDIDTMERSELTDPILVEWTDELPDIVIVGTGGLMDLGGSAIIVFQADPSGIYTLVPNKRNDTLYDRDSGEDTVDVAIPNPFIKTGFIS